MSVLVVRLAGPMQSWGTQSRFSNRDTGREPSKSGVVGLLCAALGRPRGDPVDDLAGLMMGVRVAAEGRLARDYHTALDVAKSGGGPPKECEPSVRFYLADAAFTVGLESADDGLLRRLDEALREPYWPICLGRKSFVPGVPVAVEGAADAVRPGNLRDVLIGHPRWVGDRHEGRVRFVVEVPASAPGTEPRFDQPVEPRFDQPVSFATREFCLRHVMTFFDTPG